MYSKPLPFLHMCTNQMVNNLPSRWSVITCFIYAQKVDEESYILTYTHRLDGHDQSLSSLHKLLMWMTNHYLYYIFSKTR